MTQNRSHAVMQQRAEAHEEWRAVPSRPGYWASSLGRIRGPRCVLRLSQPPSGRGYVRILGVGVHALVCEAFHGPKPCSLHETAHWDGDRTNNRQENLRWATKVENGADAKRHGVHAGEKHPRATITAANVAEIRRRRALRPKHFAGRGWRKQIALEFGISVSALSDILDGRRWAGVE